MDIQRASLLIKEEALRLGFSACGVCKPGYAGMHAEYLKGWLEKDYQGEMFYMNRHLEKRCDSSLLVENARSVIVTALNYYPERKQNPEAAQIAYYAYGKDYHLVVKEKLRLLYEYIHRDIAPVHGRIFCDTAPLLEKYHAWKAGLGWIGKNTQLIIPGKGSFFFLGEMILDIELAYDEEMIPGRCGNCTKCMDACPTHALVGPGELNAGRCLSYLSIEYNGELPDLYAKTAGNQLYGCDICNKVCPWNKQAEASAVNEFNPSDALLNLNRSQIEEMDDTEFENLFGQSPVFRIGLRQLKRNLH